MKDTEKIQKLKNGLIKKILLKTAEVFQFRKKDFSPIEYWENRARKYGKHSVVNRGYTRDQFQEVTTEQKDLIFPILRERLLGNEQIVLDFGCGPGRFTADLANLIGGKAIGVDPIQRLLKLSPKSENVEYRLMKDNIIPLEDSSVDVAWICLVIGGIANGPALENSIREIDRVLKPGALIVLSENTSSHKDAEHWKFRSVETYKKLFSFAMLEHVKDYNELTETISVMVGRKTACSS